MGALRELLFGAQVRPPDSVAWIALYLAGGLAILVLTGRGRSLIGLGDQMLPPRIFLYVGALVAALLSIAYIAIYLRGGPRIVDSTSYFLQGRALSEGFLSWPAQEPTAAFRGRFLIYRDGEIGGLFPPGYPFLLAFGFTLGAPMVIGPLLAGAIFAFTYRLGKSMAKAIGYEPEPIGRAAAMLSLVCATLRYHTADTMSHGATALWVVVSLDAALRKKPWICGLALGMCFATRPVSVLPIGLVCLILLRREALRAAIGALPGVFLLLLSQHAVTGSWLMSTQRLYYAISDGPPDCFRIGFGKGLGCKFEHGDVVKHGLENGYGLKEAIINTGKRLNWHRGDVANLPVLALLSFVPLRFRALRTAMLIIPLQILAYAPFYFDGTYPGGGARFFADILPVEHVLMVIGVASLARTQILRVAFALVALSLVGFATNTVLAHRELMVRDGGHPMFEPDLLAKQNVTAGLVFVDTDHGFALGHDPRARAKDGIVVAHRRKDDRDRLLFDRLSRPPTWIYRYENGPGEEAVPVLVPWGPENLNAETWRFDAEAEWPAIDQKKGYAAPSWTEGSAFNGKYLALTPTPLDGEAEATIEVPVPEPGRWMVGIRVVLGGTMPFEDAPGPSAVATVRIQEASWTWNSAGAGCADLLARPLSLTGRSVKVVMTAKNGPMGLDTITLTKQK